MVVWERVDRKLITRIYETRGVYIWELVDSKSGRVVANPRPVRITPAKLRSYGFKQAA